MQFPKYESYKDSGVEWLGEIPEEWEIIRVSNVGKVIDPQPDHRAPAITATGGFPYVGIRDVNKDGSLNFDTARQVHESAVVKQEQSFKIENEDIIFGKVGTLGQPKHIKPHGRCAISATLVLIKGFETVDRSFLKYSLDSFFVAEQIKTLAYGATRLALGIQQIRKLKILLPPVSRQSKIASFLDQKTAEIDEAIAKKKKLIELLQEQKSILINQAVTKGLNPDAPMKDSGVEWIGEIPAHWEVKKAKVLFKKTQHQVNHNDGIVTAFRDGEVTLRTNRRTEGFTIALLEQGYQGVRSGQLVVNSMDAFAGAIGISDSDGKCSPEYVVCDATKPSETFLPFYAYLLRNMAEKGYIQAICPAVRQRALRFRYPNLAPVLLPSPKREEQKQIVELIAKIKSTHDEATKRLSEQIAKLVELKQILISSAVTGKIKV